LTTITAQIILDSVNLSGSRLTTMQLRYPRCIHSEFMTHRVMSRNASSSRAIPVLRLIEDVLNDPFVPLHWGKNQRGMQADEECDAPIVLAGGFNRSCSREERWLKARDFAVDAAQDFAEAGYHKQIVNRLLEPFAHIQVVVTSTEWSNFFALRDHPDAEPHIRVLAQQMKKALNTSTPQELQWGQWHLPYVWDTERVKHDLDDSLKLSVARCARVSYMTHDGRKPDATEDFKLADRLLSSVPLHASPAEHQAQAMTLGWHEEADWLRGNFSRGWIQYRKTLPEESQ
jgi:hypothetical protein